MAIKVVSFVNPKGGTGKSTLTVNFAVEADRQQHGPVVVSDLDPQSSTTDWWNARSAETPRFANLTVPGMEQEIGDLDAAGVKLLFIDTPGSDIKAINKVINVSDLVVVPTQPGPNEIRSLLRTFDRIEVAQDRLVFVINDAPRAKLTADMAVKLSQFGRVAPSTIFSRVVFPNALIDGRGVQELEPNGSSANCLAELWTYLSAQMRKSARAKVRK